MHRIFLRLVPRLRHRRVLPVQLNFPKFYSTNRKQSPRLAVETLSQDSETPATKKDLDQVQVDTFWQEIQQNQSPDLDTLTSLLSFFSQNNDPRTEELFGILCNSNKATTIHLEKAIEYYCRNRDLESALFVFEGGTEKQNITPNIAIFERLMGSFFELGRTEDIYKIFRKFFALGIQPNVKTFNFAIGAFSRKKMEKETIELLNEMKKLGIPFHLTTYRNLLQLYYQLHKTEELDFIFEKMCKAQVADVKAFNLMINYKMDTKKFTEAYQLYQLMNERLVTPDSYTFNALISDEDLICNESIGFFKEMMQRKIKPTVGTFTTILSLYVGVNHERESLEVFQLIAKYGFRYEKIHFQKMIILYAKMRMSARVSYYIDRMNEYGIACDSNSYLQLVYSYRKLSNPMKIAELAYQMNQKGIIPDGSSEESYAFSAVVSVLASQGEKGLHYFEKLGGFDEFPNRWTANVLLFLYGFSNRFNYVSKVLVRMSQNGIEPDATTFKVLIYIWGALYKDLETIFVLWEEMMNHTKVSVECLIMVLEVLGRLGEVERGILLYENAVPTLDHMSLKEKQSLNSAFRRYMLREQRPVWEDEMVKSFAFRQ